MRFAQVESSAISLLRPLIEICIDSGTWGVGVISRQKVGQYPTSRILYNPCLEMI